MRKRAKLFIHGGSQAVRLPKEFRFEGKEVLIRKQGDCCPCTGSGNRQADGGSSPACSACASSGTTGLILGLDAPVLIELTT